MAEYAFLTLEPLRVKFLSERILMLLVYVISKSGKPLMPCKSVIARLLLKDGNAKVVRREPFTIKLTRETTEYTQPLTLGVDTGSKIAGFAVANEKNEIIYRSEVILRNNIKKKMDRRRMYRQSRRNRKTRYRKERFLNRKNSKRKSRLTPTIVSKLHSHEKEIEYIKSILPITTMVFEVGHFDPAAMQNPSLRNPKVIRWGYQKGPNYGLANTKAKVKYRDHYTCQICKGKTKDHKLHVHHIVYRSQGGSDKEDNLITLCETCHKNLHSGVIAVNLKGKRKSNLKYATQMNVIRSQLLKKYPNVIETFGYTTSTNRQVLGLTKYSHWLDASVIATGGNMPIFNTGVVYIKCHVAEGDYRHTSGQFSDKKLIRGKVLGFRKFDKVMYRNKLYFIRGCRSAGYFELMDIYGNDVSFSYLPRGKKTPKCTEMHRISARKSQIIWTQQLNNVI